MKLSLDRTRPFVAGLLALCLASPSALLSQSAAPPAPEAKVVDELAPLPQDDGRLGLELLLKRLKTTARLMHTTAHPDDEDGGMLTLESRGKGYDVTLMTLTHGEGGQNKTGSNLFDELGVLRVLELLESDKYYGVHQRFSMAADFGFSKSPQESLEKWKDGGKPGYIPLRDMVRVIRTFRPDVIAQRFQGSERDGHGHHQASGIITKEAFRAAADPKQFPELNLPPWQAKKLYMDNVRDGEEYTVAFDTGAEDPALGMSYVQFAMKGLKHQLSQGAGAWNVDPGPHITRYKLIDSELPQPKAGEHEKDFFDGIDTSLPALADRLGADENRVPWLKPGLEEVAKLIDQASEAEKKDMESAAAPLSAAAQSLSALRTRIENSPLDDASRRDLLSRVDEKRQQVRKAEALALGLKVKVTTLAEMAGKPSVTRGTRVPVDVAIENGGSQALQFQLADVEDPAAAKRAVKSLAIAAHGHSSVVAENVAREPLTKPGFHRDNPEVDSFYESSDADPTIPFSAGPPTVWVSYRAEGSKAAIDGSQEVPVETAIHQPDGTTRLRPLAIAPKFSVLIEPSTQTVPTTAKDARKIDVHVRSIAGGPAKGTLKLLVPYAWRATPLQQAIDFSKYGEEKTVSFQVTPGELSEHKAKIEAVFESEGKRYTEGYTTVEREDLGTYYYYQPSVQKISEVKVATQPGLKVGYIMGAGDDIPTALQQIGVDVATITPEELASGDLSKYGTIVVGIRAYDTRDDVKQHNDRLLEFVKNGGTLIVQYNAGVADFNAVKLPPQTGPVPPKMDPNSPIPGKYVPYPAELSRDRVSVEDAKITVLEPQNAIFHSPNEIKPTDFDGWVQERGLYFMDRWSPEYHALLECHDPNEPERKGGLLEAKYGKGTYIYTGYAFFRQLPVGVPGAVRLFVNLLSAGHEQH
ncbi:PIG-L family deacetylase [Candidatus Korobacter versatilis]|nr:PIG-L family deacetylase [Candidatus Koribacter versatilis]